MNKKELIGKHEQKIASYYTEDMQKAIKKANNTLDALDVFLEYLPNDILLEIVNNEISTSGPVFKAKLELIKKIGEGNANPDFTIPAMQPLPAQKKITQAEAEELAKQSAEEWTEDTYGKKKKLEDLVKIILLCNNFEIDSNETDLVNRLKGRRNEAKWFSFTGPRIWPSAKVITGLSPDPYLLANVSLRMSYFDSGEKEITLRSLQFDEFNDLSNITDLRHVVAVMEQQKLIPGINAKDYVAESHEWYDCSFTPKIQPQAIWPFFAENMAYIDSGLGIYNASKINATIYTDYAIRILSYFPSIPERYYYMVWNYLLYGPKNTISYESFMLLKRYPDFEKMLQEYAKSDSEILRTKAEFWLNELHENPQPSPKRYFISKKGDEFWNIWQNSSLYMTESGKIDNKYPHAVSNHSISLGEAKRIIEEQIKEQKAKGFKETDENGVANVIKTRNEKALKDIVQNLTAGRPLITPPTPVSINIDVKQPILDASGQPYTFAVNEGILTDITDVNYIKGTLQYLMGYIAETTFDSTVEFIRIGTLVKNKFTPLAFKKGKYCISFDVLCTEAYKHPELHEWLVALLQTIIKVNNTADPIWADEQTMLGMTLSFLLAQNRQYAQVLMDYLHSIQSASNHTYYSEELDPGRLPVETLMQVLAGFYANSICQGDLDYEAPKQTKKFKKEQAQMFLAYLEIECKYNLEVRKWHKVSVANSVEEYFYAFSKGKDAKVLATLFVDYITNK